MSLTKAKKTPITCMWARSRHRGPGEALRQLPADQDLLPALRPAPRLCAHACARLQGDGRRGRHGQEHRQHRPRPVQAERAARLHSARGPSQLPVASHFPADFSDDAHAAWDKFLSVVSSILTEKYR